MKLLLIHVPEECEHLGNKIILEPLGLEMLSSHMISQGHQTKILDLHTEKFDSEKFIRFIKKEQFSLVGFSIYYTNVTRSIEISRLIKKTIDAKIVFGGYFATIKPEIILNQEVDFIVRGEGEYTLSELALYMEGKIDDIFSISGLIHKVDNEMYFNKPRERIQDLDSLNMPDRRYIRLDKYMFLPGSPFRKKDFKMASISTSRGCNLKCGFCSCPIFWQNKWIGHSPERVVSEVELLKDKYQVNQIFFAEEDFCGDPKRAKEIACLLIEKKIKVDWICATSINNISEDLVDAFADAGCKAMYLGFESGSTEILKKMHKFYSFDKAIKLVKKCRDRNIFVGGTFMIGLPWESKKTLDETLNFMKKLYLNFFIINYFKPIPNTPYHKYVIENNLLNVENYPKRDKYYPYVKTLYLSSKDLTKAMSRFYFYTRFHPRYVMFTIKYILKNRGAIDGYIEMSRILFGNLFFVLLKTLKRLINK